jgi:hypothetical protein
MAVTLESSSRAWSSSHAPASPIAGLFERSRACRPRVLASVVMDSVGSRPRRECRQELADLWTVWKEITAARAEHASCVSPFDATQSRCSVGPDPELPRLTRSPSQRAFTPRSPSWHRGSSNCSRCATPSRSASAPFIPIGTPTSSSTVRSAPTIQQW